MQCMRFLKFHEKGLVGSGWGEPQAMWQEPGGPLMMICAQAQTERQEGCWVTRAIVKKRVDVFSLSLLYLIFVRARRKIPNLMVVAHFRLHCCI